MKCSSLDYTISKSASTMTSKKVSELPPKYRSTKKKHPYCVQTQLETVEKSKLVPKKFIYDCTTMRNWDLNQWIRAVECDGLALEFVGGNMNDEGGFGNDKLCEAAVRQNGLALQYVDDTYCDNDLYTRICKLAIKQNGLALQYVKREREFETIDDADYIHICELAVKQNGLALEFVENQTEQICEFAVLQNGRAFDYVKNTTDKLCSVYFQHMAKK